MTKLWCYLLVIGLIVGCVVSMNIGDGNIEVENKTQPQPLLHINMENLADTLYIDSIK